MQTGYSSVLLPAVVITCISAVSVTVANAADFGIYGEAGTLGLGGGVAWQFDDHLSARVGYSRFSSDIDEYEAEDLELDGEATIGAGKVLVDWHPARGTFRITAGAMINQTKATAVAVPTGGITCAGVS